MAPSVYERTQLLQRARQAITGAAYFIEREKVARASEHVTDAMADQFGTYARNHLDTARELIEAVIHDVNLNIEEP